MGKHYKDLSRRGLIQLGTDFDAENDGALLEYLTENGDKYEDIRPIESIIDRADQVSEIIGNSGRKIMAVLDGNNEGDLLDKVIDTISNIADSLSSEIDEISESFS